MMKKLSGILVIIATMLMVGCSDASEENANTVNIEKGAAPAVFKPEAEMPPVADQPQQQVVQEQPQEETQAAETPVEEQKEEVKPQKNSDAESPSKTADTRNTEED